MTRTLFVGPGAIGGLLSWHFQSFSTPLVYRHRPDLKLPSTLIEEGQRHSLEWQFPLDGEHFADIDAVVVCCKATQVETAVTPLLPMLPNAHWLICCNGMGPQQWLAEQAPGRVLWGSTTEGALFDEKGSIHHSGHGETALGPAQGVALNDQTRWFGKWLCDQSGPLEFVWDDRIGERLWLKLAVNAVINPITAVQGLPNGALATDEWKPEVDHLCKEILAIASAHGQWLPADLGSRIQAIAQATARNHSSMRVDLEAGRGTEIEFINGYLVRLALEANVKAPKLTHWYQAVLKAGS